jgi:hypothetical protein
MAAAGMGVAEIAKELGAKPDAVEKWIKSKP